MTLGVLVPEGDHFDFKPQKGVTLLISHTGVTVLPTKRPQDLLVRRGGLAQSVLRLWVAYALCARPPLPHE